MKYRHIISAGLAAGFVLGSVSQAFADPVYVKGNVDEMLFADGDLYICSVASGNCRPLGFDIVGATDVTVEACKAIVTTDSGLVVQDLTGYVSDEFCAEENECLAIHDPISRTIYIPCMEMWGDIYVVGMSQRGKSPNWQVTYYGPADN